MLQLGVDRVSLLKNSALAVAVPLVGTFMMCGAGPAQASTDLYGAVSLGVMPFRIGVAVDFPSQEAADQAARDACGSKVVNGKTLDCGVFGQVHNECGVLIQRNIEGGVLPGSNQPMWRFGKGATAEAAQKNAGYTPGVNLSKGFPILLGLGGYFGDEFVLDTLCTANAG